jgi:hypothetical protein
MRRIRKVVWPHMMGLTGGLTKFILWTLDSMLGREAVMKRGYRRKVRWDDRCCRLLPGMWSRHDWLHQSLLLKHGHHIGDGAL